MQADRDAEPGSLGNPHLSGEMVIKAPNASVWAPCWTAAPERFLVARIGNEVFAEDVARPGPSQLQLRMDDALFTSWGVVFISVNR